MTKSGIPAPAMVGRPVRRPPTVEDEPVVKVTVAEPDEVCEVAAEEEVSVPVALEVAPVVVAPDVAELASLDVSDVWRAVACVAVERFGRSAWALTLRAVAASSASKGVARMV